MSYDFKNLLLLSIPLILKYIFLLLLVDIYFIEIGDVKEDILFFTVIVALFSMLKFMRKQLFYDVLTFSYLLYFILETTSYIAVSSNFSSSYMFLLLESNKEELTEFSSSYLNEAIIIFASIILGAFFVVRRARINAKYIRKNYIKVTVVLFVVGFLKYTGLIENNAYHNIVRGAYGYINLKNNVSYNENVLAKDINISSSNEVLVVALGESTTSKHMQVYGYDEETTPFLNRIKDSLFLYSNVISTDVITTKVVPKILTSLDNGTNNNEDLVTNIIEVFNIAGFDTYWLSNQRPIGFFDNRVTEMASVSKNIKFLNHAHEVKTISYDEVLIPALKAALSKPGKKVIFLRLIGTHFDYNKRYPEEFSKFIVSSKATKKERVISYYNNAVAYNDYVVYSFIKELKKKRIKSMLLYLSDHGENVYHGNDFFGRSENSLTKSMFQIPFLVWTSKDFEFPNDFEYVPNRAFMTDHTYESLGHMFGVKYKDMDESKSIFSKSFKKRKRKVVNDIDYDSYFLNVNE
ncbi:phosphoethanolamine transferase [Seonamhaeicola marinus]|uniref:Phosphoethanolamine transferase n=1 Tax=Seonamhaeicola marinus TaxID=1912246 RepID=A0A5D0ISE8_9FLAO|nr:phosphoethanolamine transferase [Seonamhaeicola marinus]TYA86793.1 phosphoethanolamine transferase [Seonamhaeicola marinus]